jgi:hypothetical protein
MATQEQIPTEDHVLAGYLTLAQLAKQIRRSERTLARWHLMRVGPPRVLVGNTPYYSVQSVREWLHAREQKPQKIRARQASRRTPVRKTARVA